MVKNGITSPIDIRLKEKVIDLKNKKVTIRKIVSQTGVSKATVSNIWKKYQEKKSLEPKKPDRKGGNNPNSKITSEYLKIIDEEIKKKNDRTAKEIQKEVEEKTNINITERHFLKVLKSNNYTKKKNQWFMKNQIHQ